MKIYRKSDNKLIADKVRLANNFFTRSVGLLNKTHLEAGEGLLITPCNSIHSIGMKFNFDALFLDKDKKIVRLEQDIRPMRILPIEFNAKYVLEVKVRVIEEYNIQVQDELYFE